MRAPTALGRRAAVCLAAAVALTLAGCGGATPSSAPEPPASSASPSPSAARTPDLSAPLATLEADFAARVGVSAVDTGTGTGTGTGRTVEFRAQERFGYASTIKAIAAAELLRQVPAAARQERQVWTEEEVAAAGHSPATAESIDEGLTLAQLAEAAVRQSDNTALNLVLRRLGGPAALDAALDGLGDAATSVVNDEPALNRIQPGIPDDTTTPAAFTALLATYLEEDVLEPEDRATWLDWMSGNSTGDALIQAGAPAGWVVADKSGGAGAIRNDIAIVTPPCRAPILISILTEKLDPSAEYEDALVQRVAEVVLRAFG